MSDRVRRIIAVVTLICCSGSAYARTEDTLVEAIRGNDVAGAKAALAQHADPNQKLAFGATPLSWAVNTQNPDMVSALLAGGAKPNSADIDGVTPLSLACELGDASIVGQILNAGADVRVARLDGATPLAICARFGPPQAIAQMLAKGAKADSDDSRSQTPLMWAAASGRVDAMALLLKSGADMNRVSKSGFTPLFFAIKSGVVPATELLLSHGANADYRGPENTSATQLALYQKNYGAAALLVEKGADLTEQDRTGSQPIHAAAAGGDVALIRLLLAKGADPNALTGPSRIKWVTEANFGMPPLPVPPTPPLLLAAENGHEEAMKLLLAAGANPRFVAADGTNIVLAAAKGGSAQALDYALSLSPDANVANAGGQTALHMLVGGSVTPELAAMMRVLAAHGARTDIKNKYGATAAAMANDGLTEIKEMFARTFANEPAVKLADAGPRTSVSAAPPRNMPPPK